MRKRQDTPEWRALYGARAGIEGCLSQGVRLCGLRRSRYVGLAKTHLQHVLAVDDRADHARAIAMQPWPHRDQQAFDVESGGRLGHHAHSASGKRVQFSSSMR